MKFLLIFVTFCSIFIPIRAPGYTCSPSPCPQPDQNPCRRTECQCSAWSTCNPCGSREPVQARICRSAQFQVTVNEVDPCRLVCPPPPVPSTKGPPAPPPCCPPPQPATKGPPAPPPCCPAPPAPQPCCPAPLPPPSPTKGPIDCHRPTIRQGTIDSMAFSFNHGKTVRVSCDQGHGHREMIDIRTQRILYSNALTCNNGRWDPTDGVECRTRCVVPTVLDGKIQGGQLCNVGEKITISCNEAQARIRNARNVEVGSGRATISCERDGLFERIGEGHVHCGH